MEDKQKSTSVSYTLKAIKTHAKTLRDRKLISEEQLDEINEIVKLAATQWMDNDFGA